MQTMRRLAASLLGGVALLVAQEGLDSRLVDLNVVAVNSQGEPVADLTQDDFRVTFRMSARRLTLSVKCKGKI